MTTKLILVFFLVVVITVNLAHAQVTRKLPRVGYLTIRSTPSEQDDIFKHALRDLGWLEGQNYILEWRGASAKVENLSVRVTELVRLNVEVIVVSSTPSVQAARRATNTIPIIMAGAADPVGTGFVKSLSHPGGNITGLSLQSPELAGKRLELLKDITPKLDRVAFLAYRPDPAHRLFVHEAESAAANLQLEIQPLVVESAEQIDSALSEIVRRKAGALVIQPLFIGGLGHARKIIEFATKNRLPNVSDGTQFADQGGLIYYGPSRLELHKRAAIFIDKILKGAKPADLPVEQPTKFELVINLKAAKQIGLTIPPNVLARADRVIR